MCDVRERRPLLGAARNLSCCAAIPRLPDLGARGRAAQVERKTTSTTTVIKLMLCGVGIVGGCLLCLGLGMMGGRAMGWIDLGEEGDSEKTKTSNRTKAAAKTQSKQG